MRKSSCNSTLADDNVSLGTVSSVSSYSLEKPDKGFKNDGFVENASCNSINGIAIDRSKKIHVGNTSNYQAPVTFQVDVMHMYGKEKCELVE